MSVKATKDEVTAAEYLETIWAETGSANPKLVKIAMWASQAKIAMDRERDDLLEACELALEVAEDWTEDQLGGTSSLESAMAELEPVRAAIRKARGEG